MDIHVNNSVVIVFDLDDTLFSELDYLKSAYMDIAIKLDSNNYMNVYGNMLSLYRQNKDVFEYISQMYTVEKTRLIEIYRSHTPRIELKKGCLEFIRSIKKANGSIGIITDGRSSTQRSKIKALGIGEYIDYVVISEEIGVGKPDAKAFELIESQLSGIEYYYIGDNAKKDFVSPNKMGWKTIMMLDDGKNIHHNFSSFQLKEHLPNSGYVNSMIEFNVLN